MPRCPNCGVDYATMDALEMHVALEYLDEWRPWLCVVDGCGARRATKTQIKIHCWSKHKIRQPQIMYFCDDEKEIEMARLLKLTRDGNGTSRERQMQGGAEMAGQGNAHSVRQPVTVQPIHVPFTLDHDTLTVESAPDAVAALFTTIKVEPNRSFNSTIDTQEIDENDSDSSATRSFVCRVDGCRFSHYSKKKLAAHMSNVHGEMMQELGAGDRESNMNGERAADDYSPGNKLIRRRRRRTFPTTTLELRKRRAMYVQQGRMEKGGKGEEGEQEQNELEQGVIKKRRGRGRQTNDATLKQIPVYSTRNTIYCGLCQKNIVRKAGINRSAIISHAAMHMANSYQAPRFSCRLCPFKTAHENSINNHTKTVHKDQYAFDETSENWKREHVETLSQLCFRSPRYITQRMSSKWFNKWYPEEADNTNTTMDRPLISQGEGEVMLEVSSSDKDRESSNVNGEESSRDMRMVNNERMRQEADRDEEMIVIDDNEGSTSRNL